MNFLKEQTSKNHQKLLFFQDLSAFDFFCGINKFPSSQKILKTRQKFEPRRKKELSALFSSTFKLRHESIFKKKIRVGRPCLDAVKQYHREPFPRTGSYHIDSAGDFCIQFSNLYQNELSAFETFSK